MNFGKVEIFFQSFFCGGRFYFPQASASGVDGATRRFKGVKNPSGFFAGGLGFPQQAANGG
jgi:hypothetical protein